MEGVLLVECLLSSGDTEDFALVWMEAMFHLPSHSGLDMLYYIVYYTNYCTILLLLQSI